MSPPRSSIDTHTFGCDWYLSQQYFLMRVILDCLVPQLAGGRARAEELLQRSIAPGTVVPYWTIENHMWGHHFQARALSRMMATTVACYRR